MALAAAALWLGSTVGAATAAAASPAAAAPKPAAASAAAGKPADAASMQATMAALGDLGLALLRDTTGANAVVSPLAVATVLGMVQSGATGATEREIEALFGPGPAGRRAMRQSLPALAAQLRAESGGALKQGARAWIGDSVARTVPASFQRRLADRHGADATVLSFADTETARTAINRWTAEHTAGRVAELLPAGSIGTSTQLTLTAAVHFRSPWAKPFDAGQTEPRPFQTSSGTATPVPTLVDERPVAQAVVDGTQLYALPFAAAAGASAGAVAGAGAGAYDLVLALPASGSSVEALLKSADGAVLGRWRAALAQATAASAAPPRCAFSMPKFAFAPKSGSIRTSLERLGVKTAFGERAELRPMLGRNAPRAHVDDVHHAAGFAVDEHGGEAVAAAAATVKPKSLAAPPPCAVDRAFAFVLVHRGSGAPVFIGRVGDPARAE